MLRHGPIPTFVHGILGYAFAVVLIAAPFVLDFDASAATAVSLVAGIAMLVVEAASEMPTGLARVVPVGIHVVLDFVVSAVLIASPFLFGFRDDTQAVALFLVLGVVGVLVTIGTRFLPPRARGAEA